MAHQSTNIKTVAVTGATGFIGAWLTERLYTMGYSVRALSRGRGAEFSRSVRVVHGSLEDQIALNELCQGSDIVVHCAGAIKGRQRDDFLDANVNGTKRLIAAASQARCQKAVVLSSLAARAPQLSHYAESKRAAETLFEDLGNTLSWTLLRPPAVYGPSDRETLKIFQMMKYRFAATPGSGDSLTSFLYVDDLCDAIIACFDSERTNRRIIEVRDDQPGGYDWEQVCLAAALAFDRSVTPISIPRWLMLPVALANEVTSKVTGNAAMLTRQKLNELFYDEWRIDENELCTLTSWTPKTSLKDGFAQTIRWYREHGWL